MAVGIPTDEGTPVSLNLTSYRKIFARPSWHEMGACRNKPTKWWFSRKPHENMGAMVVCRELCPVRWRCLADNLDVPHGIFGGFTAEDRKVIREEYPVLVEASELLLALEEDDTVLGRRSG